MQWRSSARGRVVEDPADDGELVRRGRVRGAEEDHLLVVEFGPCPHDGERLDRLRGRAQERHEPGIARRQLDAAVAHRDRVDDVARLDDRPARDLDDDRVHGARA